MDNELSVWLLVGRVTPGKMKRPCDARLRVRKVGDVLVGAGGERGRCLQGDFESGLLAVGAKRPGGSRLQQFLALQLRMVGQACLPLGFDEGNCTQTCFMWYHRPAQEQTLRMIWPRLSAVVVNVLNNVCLGTRDFSTLPPEMLPSDLLGPQGLEGFASETHLKQAVLDALGIDMEKEFCIMIKNDHFQFEQLGEQPVSVLLYLSTQEPLLVPDLQLSTAWEILWVRKCESSTTGEEMVNKTCEFFSAEIIPKLVQLGTRSLAGFNLLVNQAKTDIFQSDKIAKLAYEQILEFRKACRWLRLVFLAQISMTPRLTEGDRLFVRSFFGNQARLTNLSKSGHLTSLPEAQSILSSFLAFLERLKLLLAPGVIDLSSMAEYITRFMGITKQSYVRLLTQSNMQLQRLMMDPLSRNEPLVRILKLFGNLRSRMWTQLNRTGAAPQPIVLLNKGTSSGRNFGTNRGTNAGTNYGLNEGANSGTNRGIIRGTNGGFNTGISCGTNPGWNFGINLGVNSGINIGINLGTNPGINAGVTSGANKGCNFGSSFGSNIGPNNDFGTGDRYIDNTCSVFQTDRKPCLLQTHSFIDPLTAARKQEQRPLLLYHGYLLFATARELSCARVPTTQDLEVEMANIQHKLRLEGMPNLNSELSIHHHEANGRLLVLRNAKDRGLYHCLVDLRKLADGELEEAITLKLVPQVLFLAGRRCVSMTRSNVIVIGQSKDIQDQLTQSRFQLVIWGVLANLELNQGQVVDLKDCLPAELYPSFQKYDISNNRNKFSVSWITNSKFIFLAQPAAGKGVIVLLERLLSTPAPLRVCSFVQTERPVPKTEGTVHFFRKLNMDFILTGMSDTSYDLYGLFRDKFYKIKARGILGRHSLPWSPDVSWTQTHPNLTFEHMPLVKGHLLDDPTERQTLFRFVSLDIQV